jgi:hypothetical protein
MRVGPTMAVMLAAVLFGGSVLDHLGAQTTLETQRGAPPSPNAAAPEYAPTPVAPAQRPTIEPSPGKPGLPPAPGTTGNRGQLDIVARSRTILGLSPMTAFFVGLGLVGLFVVVLGAMTGRPKRWRRVGQEHLSHRAGGLNRE